MSSLVAEKPRRSIRHLRHRFSPLFRRLLIWFCAANIATLVVSVIVTERIARRTMPAEPDWWTLAREADAVYVEHGPHALDSWVEQRRNDQLDVALFEEGFNLAHAPLPEPVAYQIRELLAADSLVLRPRPDLVVVSLRILGEDDVPRQFIAYRRYPRPWAPVKEFLTLELLLSLAGIGVVGWWLARGISQPVDAVAAAARGMAAGELSTRVDAQWAEGDDEMAMLARDFNAMATRIEALVTQERSVLQDVSHELRSPLARLRLNLALAQRGDGPPPPQLLAADREVSRLDRLLTEVLSLARLETDLPGMAREFCELGTLAQVCVDNLADAAKTAGSAIDIDAPQPLFVHGSTALLERAIENLLGNALKYASGKPIHIVIRAEAGGLVGLRVIDQGPGVPAEELKNLFRPFFRGTNAPLAEGQGLGLAIVARIARAHGGRATASAAPGGGLEVALLLPATASPR